MYGVGQMPHRRNRVMKYMFIAAVLLAATSAHAEGQFPAKKAQCFLQVNGAAKIDGLKSAMVLTVVGSLT